MLSAPVDAGAMGTRASVDNSTRKGFIYWPYSVHCDEQANCRTVLVSKRNQFFVVRFYPLDQFRADFRSFQAAALLSQVLMTLAASRGGMSSLTIGR